MIRVKNSSELDTVPAVISSGFPMTTDWTLANDRRQRTKQLCVEHYQFTGVSENRQTRPLHESAFKSVVVRFTVNFITTASQMNLRNETRRLVWFRT
jgi:hypothetical protein